MSGRISKSIASGLFAVRPLILLAFIAATVLLGFQASKIQLNTDIRKMVPLDHPYIQNFLEHQNDLSLGNDVRVIVAETQGDDIFNEDYVNALKEITDEVFALGDSKVPNVCVAPLKGRDRAVEKAGNMPIGPDKHRTEGPAIAWVHRFDSDAFEMYEVRSTSRSGRCSQSITVCLSSMMFLKARAFL